MNTPVGDTAAPDIRRLDFSLFHPQDHRAFDARCRRLPGGGPRHLRDWWDYRFEYRPDLIKGRLACRLLKRHDYRESWHAHKATPAEKAGLERRRMFYDGRSCWVCYKDDPDPADVPDVCPDHEAQRAAEAAHWAAVDAANAAAGVRYTVTS
jgi:hypothetical protein